MRKRKTVIKGILLIAVSLLGLTLSARWLNKLGKKGIIQYDGKEELKILYEKYSHSGASYDISGIINLYDRENGDVLKEVLPFRTVKNGTWEFTELGSQRTFLLDSILLQLDTLHKFLVVRRIDTSQLLEHKLASFPFEKYFEDTTGLKVQATVTDNGTERILKISNDLMPEVRTTSIYYDAADYTVRKTEIDWWKEPGDINRDPKKCWRSRVSYQYDFTSTFDVAVEMAKIINFKNGIPEPAEEYKDYEITVDSSDYLK